MLSRLPLPYEVWTDIILPEEIKNTFRDDWVKIALEFVRDWAMRDNIIWQVIHEALRTILRADCQDVLFLIECHWSRDFRWPQRYYVDVRVLVVQASTKKVDKRLGGWIDIMEWHGQLARHRCNIYNCRFIFPCYHFWQKFSCKDGNWEAIDGYESAYFVLGELDIRT